MIPEQCVARLKGLARPGKLAGMARYGMSGDIEEGGEERLKTHPCGKNASLSATLALIAIIIYPLHSEECALEKRMIA